MQRAGTSHIVLGKAYGMPRTERESADRGVQEAVGPVLRSAEGKVRAVVRHQE